MRILHVVLLLGLTASNLDAQRIAGVLTSSEDGTPVPGAVVTAFDDRGNASGRTLTNQGGQYTISLQTAGRFRLQVERIGFETTFSPYLQVAGGQTVVYAMALPMQAIVLEGITAQVRRRCRARSADAGQHRVWEEARKALTAVALTEKLRHVSFRIRTIEREVDLHSGLVYEERGSEAMVLNSYPFQSAPAAELMRKGFIQQVADTTVYHAPDAHVLLSDEFLDGYCFSIQRDKARGEMIGLAFEPVPQRSSVSRVAGVLWLDSRTAELRQLEYRYLRHAMVPDMDRFGGQLNFERLENGAWIVRDWRIRAPRARVVWEGPMARVRRAIHETVGEVAAITQADHTRQLTLRAGTIRGRLLNAEARTPVEGATVYVSGTQYTAVTDTAGEFRIDSVPEGRYLIASYHPALNPNGYLVQAVEAELPRDGEIAVDLLMRGRTAQPAAEPRSPSRLVGRVLDAETDEPVAAVRIRITGTNHQALTDTQGRFFLTGVPAGEVELETSHIRFGTRREVAAIRAGETMELTIRLTTQAIVLEGIVATARPNLGLEDFHRRMAEGRGRATFFDRKAIEARNALRVEQMLTEYGVVVDRSGVSMPRSASSFGACGPMVYIDGIAVTHPGMAGDGSGSSGVSPADARDALLMVNPSQLEGIELYRSASQVPIDLGGSYAGCGVIMLWTRRGS
jgi:hypothetical protein